MKRKPKPKMGRPRKGTEVRETLTVRLPPSLLAAAAAKVGSRTAAIERGLELVLQE